MEESKPLLDTEVTTRIDLADLIEREQIKTLENLSGAIEALQAELVKDLEALGWKKIPALVKDVSSEEAFLTGLIENLQRNIRISPVAEARGYKHLMAKGWTPHEIAQRIGKGDSYVYDRLRVVDRLHPTIQRR